MRTKTHHYHSQLRWTGGGTTGTDRYQAYGRDYAIVVPGKPVWVGSADPAFLGDPSLHNPEDLFLGAIAACHMLTYLALCAHAGVQVLSYEDQAQGWLEQSGTGGRFKAIQLSPHVTISANSNAKRAHDLHTEAHAQCFIASSCSTNIDCQPNIVTVSDQPGTIQ